MFSLVLFHQVVLEQGFHLLRLEETFLESRSFSGRDPFPLRSYSFFPLEVVILLFGRAVNSLLGRLEQSVSARFGETLLDGFSVRSPFPLSFSPQTRLFLYTMKTPLLDYRIPSHRLRLAPPLPTYAPEVAPLTDASSAHIAVSPFFNNLMEIWIPAGNRQPKGLLFF